MRLESKHGLASLILLLVGMSSFVGVSFGLTILSKNPITNYLARAKYTSNIPIDITNQEQEQNPDIDYITNTQINPTSTDISNQQPGQSQQGSSNTCSFRPVGYINIVTNPLEDSREWNARYFTEAQRLGWQTINDKNSKAAFNASSASDPCGRNGCKCEIGGTCGGYVYGSDTATVSLVPQTDAEKYDLLGICKHLGTLEDLDCRYYDTPLTLTSNTAIGAISDLPVCKPPPGDATRQTYQFGWIIRERPSSVTAAPTYADGIVPTPKLYNDRDQGYVESHSLPCGVGFSIVLNGPTKTRIDGLTLRSTTSNNQFNFGAADVVHGSSGGNSPIGAVVGRAPGQPREFINIEMSWDPNRTVYEHSGIPKGSLVVILRNSYVARTRFNPGNVETSYFYYFKENIPDWINTDTIEAALYYTITEAMYTCPMNKRFVDKARARPCDIQTTPTPTVWIPTDIPTRTPTITRIPTQTPPPPPCDAQVHFLIDASATILPRFDAIRNDLGNAVKAYFTNYPSLVGHLKITYQYFTWKPHEIVELTGPNYTFGPYNGTAYWTNLKLALSNGIHGTTILVTDGIPSVLDDYKYGQYFATFGVVGCMTGNQSGANSCSSTRESSSTNRTNSYWEGCVLEGQNTPTRHRDCPGDMKNMFQSVTYEDAYQKTYQFANKQAHYGYVVDKEDEIEEMVIKASKQYKGNDITKISSDLDDIINKACSGQTPQNTPNTPSSPSNPNIPLPPQNQENEDVFVSYEISNNSTKTITSTQFTLCDENGAGCTDKIINDLIEPEQVYNDTIHLPLLSRLNLSQIDKLISSCTITFEDESTQICDNEVTIGADNGIQIQIGVRDDGVDNTTKSISETLDFNKDKCVNVLDFVILQNKIKSYKPGDLIDEDVVLDGKLNSQDTSLLTQKFGYCWE